MPLMGRTEDKVAHLHRCQESQAARARQVREWVHCSGLGRLLRAAELLLHRDWAAWQAGQRALCC